MLQKRKQLRLRDHDHMQGGAYFLTLCTWDRICLFGDSINDDIIATPHGVVAQQCWEEIPAHFPDVIIDAYCVMPNHVHGIITVGNNHGCSLRPLSKLLAAPRSFLSLRLWHSLWDTPKAVT